MPRRSSSKKLPVAQAIVELRAKLRLTQQQFASRLGLAHQTVARWETKVPPTGVMLKILWQLADENNLLPAGDAFRDAYLREVEEREGLVGRFSLDGATRKRLSQIVKGLGELFGEKELNAEDASQALEDAYKRYGKDVFLEGNIFKRVSRELQLLLGNLCPPGNGEPNPSERLAAARKSVQAIDEELNSYYIVSGK